MLRKQGLDALHVDAYPTDQRLKHQQKIKEDKLAGNAPKRKPQIVEQLFDDCGSDFGPISFVDAELADEFACLDLYMPCTDDGPDLVDLEVLEQLNHLVHPFFGMARCDADDSDAYIQKDQRNILQYDGLMVVL